MVFKRTKVPDSCTFGSSFWANSIPPFCITLCSACLTFSQLPRFLFPTVFPFLHCLPPFSSRNLLSTLPSFLSPFSYDPVPPDPSFPAPSTLFCSVCSFHSLFLCFVIRPECWFSFYFCLGWQNCHLLWLWSSMLLPAVWCDGESKENREREQIATSGQQDWPTDKQSVSQLGPSQIHSLTRLSSDSFSVRFVSWVYTLAGWVFSKQGGCLCSMG